MMKKRFTLGSIALLAALLGVVLTTAPALAHEKRHVGPYTFVVGFLDEPAYANVKNSLDLTVCDGSSCNYTVQNAAQVLSNPVNDVDKTLKVEVSTGGSTPLALTLEPRYANPGKYNAYFLPTKVGDYTFHFFGTINNNHINEKFTSSPTGFSSVEQVPTYPSGSADPANAQLTVLKSQAQSAQNSATTAMTVGILGAIFGILGLVTAGFALARKSRYAGASATEIKTPPDSLRG
ncbi:MAG TPA: hypothetical protein VGL94_18910 [Ktedonobacteraceae bacterium]